jgi:Holliday junction resolvase YEN1
MPFLPIFVFDGPKRPKIKRGKSVGGKQHWMIHNFRVVLDAFGFECRTAPGEAEAELAYLNSIGIIDAVLSDDVDCFLFGAQTVMRNSSSTLSGNRSHGAKNADGKDDGQHVNIYRMADIETNDGVKLTKGGLILIALLRGGDYDQVRKIS